MPAETLSVRAGTATEFGTQPGARNDVAQGRRPRLRVMPGHELSRHTIVNRSAQATDVGGQHRSATRLCLERHQTK
jgi:hypothetical protein